MRTNPHILEVNTGVWLKLLSDRYAKPMTICHVPDECLDEIKAMGFDAVWLMGVWQKSPKAQEIARANEEINRAVSYIFPDYKKEDIKASPYSVYAYTVDSEIGTEEGLKDLKRRFNERGIALLLDFVGNHLAIDHPKTLTDPDLFINTGTNPPTTDPDLFFKTENGYYIAHGRDPFFPPWTDTAQLNYFNPKTQDYMMEVLKKIMTFCDGVRCDMAMLSLNKVQKDTWWKFLGGQEPGEEFWTRAVREAREINSDFIFIAEVYWGLEWEIQEMGFDYTYDKVMYDRLRFSSAENIKGHLGAEHLYQMRSIRFISNHDEESAMQAFGRDKALAASTLIATIPGARMFFCQQLYGYKHHLPVQYVGYTGEADAELFNFYTRLLSLINHPSFHGGQWTIKNLTSVNDSETHKNILAWTWIQGMEHKLVVINYSGEQSIGHMTLNKHKFKTIAEDLQGLEITESADELYKNGLTVDLKPYESRIYSLTL
ncbi:hypothetical protein AAIR98_000307 [Elusimicrobium simillimum]|uniref:alpha-amylase family glycosyl hydrolase n=1 Tax=Elusimicrobium simillimum TaxID=3143438 RepID=UPI003C6F1152